MTEFGQGNSVVGPYFEFHQIVIGLKIIHNLFRADEKWFFHRTKLNENETDVHEKIMGAFRNFSLNGPKPEV
jgi:hypothetical protein